jgi:hypothetical protein
VTDRLGWRNSHKNPPEVGQEVYYFGPNIGIGIGRYHYEEQRIVSEKGNRDIELCPHIFTNNHWGVVDACDAPYWQPYDPERAKSWCPVIPVGHMREIVDMLDAIKSAEQDDAA